MSVPIASLSPAAALAATLGKGDAVAESVATADSAPFAALVQRLMAKQGAGASDLNELLFPGGASTDQDSEAGPSAGDLNALLPFLEALGLIQPPPAENAVAAGNPAIPAAALPTRGAAEESMAEAALQTGSAGIAAAVPEKKIGADGTGEAMLRGQEFASQLVETIAAAKQDPHAPGNTAAAVQQVIASVAPRGSDQPTQTVAQPVGTPGWSEEIGNKIVWMANRLESKAELVLTPPQMGRVEVSLSITGDQATANFVSGNPAVREALEAALPRLREVLAEAGIQLGQTQVGAENARQSAQQDKNPDNFGFAAGSTADNAGLPTHDGSTSVAAGLKMGRGLVDVFA